MQHIPIEGRVFQQVSQEPLGDDWREQLHKLQRVGQSSTTAIMQAVTNADPTFALVRNQLSYVSRTVADLPEGEAKEALLQQVADLRKAAEQARTAASLAPTQVRAGKQATKRQKRGRQETDRRTKPLFPGRKRRKVDVATAAEPSDPLPPMRKKDESAKKVGGRFKAGHVCCSQTHLLLKHSLCMLQCLCRCVA